MKTDNVALQLSQKRMTRTAVWQGKIQTLMDFVQLRKFSAENIAQYTSFLSNQATASANTMEYRP